MKQVLIPIDFTEESYNTVQYGMQLAREIKRNLQLLHVIDLYEFGMNYSYPDRAPLPEISNELIEIRKTSAKESFEKLLKTLERQKDGHPNLKYSIEVGTTTKQIINRTRNKEVDFILLPGKDGNNKLNQLLNTSYYKIISQADAPVWIIPSGISFKKIQKIVYATDFNDEDIPSLKKIVRFAARSGTEIIALHVTKDINFQLKVKQKGFQSLVKEKIDYDNISIFSIASSHGITRINEFAMESGADLIVILKENRSLLEKLFTKSTTRQLTIETSLPLLVFHEPSSASSRTQSKDIIFT